MEGAHQPRAKALGAHQLGAQRCAPTLGGAPKVLTNLGGGSPKGAHQSRGWPTSLVGPSLLLFGLVRFGVGLFRFKEF